MKPLITWERREPDSQVLVVTNMWPDAERPVYGIFVKRQVESFLQELPIDYFVWLFHWGMIPREEALPMLELFATEIMPEFGMDASSLEAAAASA